MIAQSNKELRIIEQLEISIMDSESKKNLCKSGNIIMIFRLGKGCPYIVNYNEIYKTKKDRLCVVREAIKDEDLNRLT